MEERGMAYLNDEKAFEIPVRIYEANLRAGQAKQWADLLEVMPDILPELFDKVQLSWDRCPRVKPEGVADVDFSKGK
jgi:hypothetical protein